MTAAQHPELDEMIEHCMGTLDAAASDRMRAHLSECPECGEQVEELRRDLALVAMSVPLSAPPSAARAQLMRAVVGTAGSAMDATDQKNVPQAPASGNVSPPPSHKLAPIRTRSSSSGLFWGGWLAAAACLIFALHTRRENRGMHQELQTETAEILRMNRSATRAQEMLDVLSSPHAQRVTLVGAHAKPQPTGHVAYMKDRGALVFTAGNLAPLPPKKTYELWIIPASGTAPIPAGTFQPDVRGAASILLPNLPIGIEAKTFGVTMENSGGSATPTMPILLAGS